MNMSKYVWRCQCCGKDMLGLPMSVAYEAPRMWYEIDETTRSRSSLEGEICIIRLDDKKVNHFIHCELSIPVRGIDGSFEFGVWACISKESLDIYKAGRETGTFAEKACHGYFMHDVFGFEGSLHAESAVIFRPGKQRPEVRLRDGRLALARAQAEGVPIKKIEELASAGDASERRRNAQTK